MSELTIPLFPLNTVLYPGGILPLKIFEPRYVDMVGECMRNTSPFGVVLIQEGRETGVAASFESVGTTALIEDWEQGEDGLLKLTVRGQRRFRVCESDVQDNQLVRATVELLDDGQAVPVTDEYMGLVAVLLRVADGTDLSFSRGDPGFADASWVTGRLAELLPIPLQQKQRLLELDTAEQRRHVLAQVLGL